jgi:hypothetical protein
VFPKNPRTQVKKLATSCIGTRYQSCAVKGSSRTCPATIQAAPARNTVVIASSGHQCASAATISSASGKGFVKICPT